MEQTPSLWNNFQRGYFSKSTDIIPYLKFTLTIESVELSVPRYNQYQQFLYDTIIDFRSKGFSLKKIADWFNENCYRTARGKIFKSSHVHSILKKKNFSDDRFNQTCKTSLSKFELEFEDRTLVNSD